MPFFGDVHLGNETSQYMVEILFNLIFCNEESYCGGLVREFRFILYIMSHQLKHQHSVSLFIMYDFVLSVCPASSRIPFQACLLLSDMLRPTSNIISHERHAQIANLKPHPLHSVLHFTYRHQIVIRTQRTDSIQ